MWAPADQCSEAVTLDPQQRPRGSHGHVEDAMLDSMHLQANSDKALQGEVNTSARRWVPH